jgi:hypothetical protein
MSDNATSSLKVKPLNSNNWCTFHPAMTAVWPLVCCRRQHPATPIPIYFVATSTPPAPLTAQEVLANSTLENNFSRKNDFWFDKDKKAHGNLLALVLVTQHMHIEGESTTYAMWQVLIKVHVCQSVQPDLVPEGARVTLKDVGGWTGCSGAYWGVCLSRCTLWTCTQRRCTCTVPL